MRITEKTILMPVLVCAVIALSACGSSRTDRALSGDHIPGGVPGFESGVDRGAERTGRLGQTLATAVEDHAVEVLTRARHVVRERRIIERSRDVRGAADLHQLGTGRCQSVCPADSLSCEVVHRVLHGDRRVVG